MTSVFSRLRQGLAKTAQQIRERLSAVTAGDRASAPSSRSTGSETPETLEALEDVLIGADVGMAATERIMTVVRAGRQGTARERVAVEVRRILDGPAIPPAPTVPPRVILIVGVNGTGKTTSVGKLANWFKSNGESVLICAADTFRAAAVEQLAIWADRAGVDLVRARSGADPAAVAFDAVTAGKARQRDVVLVDTAGRLHTRVNLMAELEKIRRIVSREVPGAPHDVWLVLDATVGQNGLVQAREFMAAGGVNGIILTKLDGTAKGGIAVAIAHDLGLPIRFVGVGEAIDDLIPFDAEAYVDALFTDTW